MAWIAGSFRSSAIVSLESDPLFGLTRTSQALVAWRIREKAVSVRLAAPRLASTAPPARPTSRATARSDRHSTRTAARTRYMAVPINGNPPTRRVLPRVANCPVVLTTEVGRADQLYHVTPGGPRLGLIPRPALVLDATVPHVH